MMYRQRELEAPQPWPETWPRERVFVDTHLGGKAHILRIDGLTYCGHPAMPGCYRNALPDSEVCGNCLRSRRAAEALRDA